MRSIYFCIFMFIAFQLKCQPIYKYAISHGFNIGSGYVDPKGENQEKWKYVFFPSVAFAIKLHILLNKEIELNSQIGGTYYNNVFRSEHDEFNAHFMTPLFGIGIKKLFPTSPKKLAFFTEINIGTQPNFKGIITEHYTSYSAFIYGQKLLQIFLSPQMGIRKNLLHGRSFEIGIMYQLGLMNVGKLLLEKNGNKTEFISNGNYLGISLRWIYPVFKFKKIETKNGAYPNKPKCP